MENKLTWVELKKAVTRQTHLSEKEVNLILTTWLEEMKTALKRGEEVRITGLGTFKMKTMKARKSVDVTTGEAIILPETDRLTFSMASGLDEMLRDDAVSKLKAGIDPIQKLSEQADEIMDIIGEIKAIGQEDEEEKRQEGEEERRREGEEAIGQEGEEAIGQSEKARRQEPKEKERLWLTAGITVLVFIGLLIGLFFFFQYKIEGWLNNLRAEAEMVEVEQMTDNRLQVTDTIESTEAIESIETIEPTEAIETTQVNYREYTDFFGTEQMHQDSRLAWMAYRYYGNKKLWVFIYDANKDHLSNPEQIAVGTPIRIPKLNQNILDFGDDIQVLVEQMQKEFIAR